MKIGNVLLLGALICMGVSFFVPGGWPENTLAVASVILAGLSFFFGIDINISIEFPRKDKEEEQ